MTENEPKPLAGRVAVVTGGGRGVGAAIADRLARAGAHVAVTARTEAQVARVAAALGDFGVQATAVPCDVADPAAVERLARQIQDELGVPSILVNGAGIATSAPVGRVSLEEWERTLAVNATGPFLCIQAFLPSMIERGWGRIINIASTAGLTAGRYIAAYAASKHALVGLTRAVAAEVAARGVTANAICPGYLDTDMTAETVRRLVSMTGRSPSQVLDALMESNPQRRLIAPEEVAELAMFLCTDAARSMNGAALVVDGGEIRR